LTGRDWAEVLWPVRSTAVGDASSNNTLSASGAGPAALTLAARISGIVSLVHVDVGRIVVGPLEVRGEQSPLPRTEVVTPYEVHIGAARV
jgi:hypothetical protein